MDYIRPFYEKLTTLLQLSHYRIKIWDATDGTVTVDFYSSYGEAYFTSLCFNSKSDVTIPAVLNKLDGFIIDHSNSNTDHLNHLIEIRNVIIRGNRKDKLQDLQKNL
jgi:hypothetical protein